MQTKISKLKSGKKRTLSSKRWLLRQINDPYVHKAKSEGYRSRAAYKLLEINQKYKIIKPGMSVLDLGAAPGGWCQVVSQLMGKKGQIIGVDLQDIEPLSGVTFLKGDFLDETIQNEIFSFFNGTKADLIISDMAAAACGIPHVDHIRLMGLLESAFMLCFDLLKPGGTFIAKVLRGGTENQLLTQLKKSFAKVNHMKPPSSRKESSELYVIAMGFRGQHEQKRI